jgi:integrase/recombinase XerD
LNVTCKAALEKYLAVLPPNSPYLFPSEKTGDRLTEQALRHLIQKYMKAARLEGLSVHDSLDTTMIYVKAIRADLQTELEIIDWK